jgi:O-antigen/teichoic acid export membrane protein
MELESSIPMPSPESSSPSSLDNLDGLGSRPTEFSGQNQTRARGFGATLSKNIAASLARVLAVALAALVLPAYLTHRLPVATYAAWVLILQLAAYVSYLDLGIQTGVSKFVAEYEARGDDAGAGRHASAGLGLMAFTGGLGLVLTLILAWQVPRLFWTMPPSLYHDVRLSVLLLGSSLSLGLICSVYSAVFLGLQRYWIPMAVAIVNRTLFAAVVVMVVAFHGSLAEMGIAAAAVNISTGFAQVAAWWKKARHIRLSLHSVEYRVLKKVARYCSVQSISIVAMLCITGLDVTIVGHYDYVQTGYYSIATLPTSFALAIIGSMMGPLMPASSALSTQRSAFEMGDLLTRVTRYTTAMLLITGLPLIVCGLPLLGIWVGSSYALGTIRYLRILVFANIVRNLCAPYATMICATDRQAPATASAISEAAVNLGSSIYLARHFGAVGVALGTVLGAVVGVLLHFAISMHFTQQTLAVSRSRLFVNGMLRPALIAVPSLVLSRFWIVPAHTNVGPRFIAAWGVGTLILAWFCGLSAKERSYLVNRSFSLIH